MPKVTLIPPIVRARLEDRDQTSPRGRLITAGFASSPLGRLMLAEVDGALCRVGYVDGAGDQHWKRLARRWHGATLRRDDEWAQRKADGLFDSGADSVDVLLRGTAFQLDVWQALLGVPAGSTESYGGLARRARRPGAFARGGRGHERQSGCLAGALPQSRGRRRRPVRLWRRP